MNYKALVAAALAAVVMQANALDENVPAPWFKNGEQPAMTSCKAGFDPEVAAGGTQNLTLRCDAVYEGFVGIMQSFVADDYRGQRIRFSGLVKADSVEGWAGLWMRIDDKDKHGAAFDNMQQRPIKGTTGWTPYSVVLDVSDRAAGIFFGILLHAKGQVWLSDIRFEVVDSSIQTTGVMSAPVRTSPGNLELSR